MDSIKNTIDSPLPPEMLRIIGKVKTTEILSPTHTNGHTLVVPDLSFLLHRSRDGRVYQLDNLTQLIATTQVACEVTQVEMINDLTPEQIQLAHKLYRLVHSEQMLNFVLNGHPDSAIEEIGGVYWQPLLPSVIEKSVIATALALRFVEVNNPIYLLAAAGGHHAESNRILGFGAFNGIALAAKLAMMEGKKVAVLDLDAHRPNGTQDILQGYENCRVISVDTDDLPFWNKVTAPNIVQYPVNNLGEYNTALNHALGNLEDFEPDLVLYLLGIDCWENSSKGGIKNMTVQQMVAREQAVLKIIKNYARIIFPGGMYLKRDPLVDTPETIQQKHLQASNLFSHCLSVHFGDNNLTL